MAADVGHFARPLRRAVVLPGPLGAHPIRGCRWGLKPSASSRLRAGWTPGQVGLGVGGGHVLVDAPGRLDLTCSSVSTRAALLSCCASVRSPAPV